MTMDINQRKDDYFSSYKDLDVHKLMLEDIPRTEAYRKAILSNQAYFREKVVMDVGCGTGILSIFCAQAGAKKVYAVEASDLAELAREIISENKLENVIEVIHSRVEDLVLPYDTKVDVIISEWMGFYLLHEGMLDSVFAARDMFLKEDGNIFPETAAIYVAPCSVPSLNKKWNDLYGVSMTSFAKHLRVSKSNNPEIMNVAPEDLIGEEVVFGWINLREDKLEDLESFHIQHVVGAKLDGYYQGLCIWFECTFPNLSSDQLKVVLSTGPNDPQTHWKQTVIVLQQEQELEKGDPIAFQLDMNRDKMYNRRYNLQLTLLDPDEVEHPMPCTCNSVKCKLINAYMIQHPELPESKGIIEEDNIEDADSE